MRLHLLIRNEIHALVVRVCEWLGLLFAHAVAALASEAQPVFPQIIRPVIEAAAGDA